MNKAKKIAIAAVSVVMAGTMVFSLAGCKKETKKKIKGSEQPTLTPTTDKDGNLSYASGTTLKTAIGYDNKGNTGIKYNSTLIGNLINYTNADSSTQVTLYGKNYGNNALKPAWAELASTLGVTINDTFANVGSADQMTTITGSEGGISGYHIFTASGSDINSTGMAGKRGDETLLDIAHYLDYMPNYKAFLDANPIVRLSLTADANGAMYMLPYFDGNDDIEKFVLLRKDLVEVLLDGKTGEDLTSTISFKTQGANKGLTTTSASAESFMGTSGNWEIKVTDPSVLTNYEGSTKTLWGNDLHVVDASNKDNLTKTVTVKVDYDAVKTAAQNDSTPLGAAVKAAAGKTYTTNSGNIVDLQNFAINESQGNVTGGQLLTIMREYIKIAYTSNGNPFYVGANKKLSDVFNSAYAAWDADLYTALGRCYVTCGSLMGDQVKSDENLYLLTGREFKAQRYNDTLSLAGELYGVRGLESRYQYAYIKADGTLADARAYEATYEAANKLYKLTAEGINNEMKTTSNITNGWSTSSAGDNKGVQALSLHDYVQTQTAKGGFQAEQSTSNPYNLGPVLTPVSRWDTNDDGTPDKVMRFTESWRGVKDTGWCISYNAVKDKPDELAAALKLVDYFFSNDGQILMTYGPQSTNGNDNGSPEATTVAGNGFWYGTKVTNAPAAATTTVGGQKVVTEAYQHLYFAYKNELYTGTYYKGRMIPTMTDSSLAMFNSTLGGQSFTNYARYYIGSALNIGNKDQGFEYQCTAKCGLAGSDVVNIALVNGTIEHPNLELPQWGTTSYENWCTLSPSLLPYAENVSTAISVSPYTLINGFGKKPVTYFSKSSDTGETNLLIDIAAYGLGSGHAVRAVTGATIPDSAAAVVAYLNTLGNNDGIANLMTRFEGFEAQAWETAVKLYNSAK